MKTNSGRRILLVEDDRHDLNLAIEALEQIDLGDRLDVTRDGAEALAYLFRQGDFADRGEANPVVVLLDLKLPKVDGIEVLEAMRRDRRTHAIPVVVFSSSPHLKDISQSYESGSNAYVVKPLDFDEFTRVLQNLGTFWSAVNQPPPEL